MNCKEYLMSYKTRRWEIVRLEEKIAEIKSQAERTTTILSGMPRGGGERHGDDVWAKLADTKEMYKNKLLDAVKMQVEIEAFIDIVPGVLFNLILKLRYLDCLTWEEIAERIDYEPRWTQHLHGMALDKARAIYARREACE